MFDIFIDLFTAIKCSFSPQPSTRKRAGAAFALIALGVGFSAFTCWVSQPRYKDILGGLSEMHAWIFSGIIALGMLLMINFIAHEIIKFRSGGDLSKAVSWICILVVGIGIFDCVKNVQGSVDRAKEIAVQAEYKYTTAALPYSDKIADLKSRITEIQKPYWWKGKLYFAAYPVTRHKKAKFNRDEQEVISLKEKISFWEAKQTASIDQADMLTDSGNSFAAQKQEDTQTGLMILSCACYFLMLVVALASASIIDGIEDDLEFYTTSARHRAKAPGEVGFAMKKDSDYRSGGIGFKTVQKPRDYDTHITVEKNTVDLRGAHTKFSRVNQPTQYRGISEKQYKKFVDVAISVLSAEGRYNKTAIARKCWQTEDRRKVDRYLKVAFERNDLKNE